MSLILSSFPFDDVDRVFDDVFSNTANRPRNGSTNHSHVSRAFRPRMDVQENKEANLVTATFELPGLKKEDVAIDVHNGRLVVSGHVRAAHEDKKDGYVVRERRAGKFMRQLSLPSGVKPEHIKAALSDGVLTVTWPKTTAEQQAKRIAIN